MGWMSEALSSRLTRTHSMKLSKRGKEAPPKHSHLHLSLPCLTFVAGCSHISKAIFCKCSHGPKEGALLRTEEHTNRRNDTVRDTTCFRECNGVHTYVMFECVWLWGEVVCLHAIVADIREMKKKGRLVTCAPCSLAPLFPR